MQPQPLFGVFADPAFDDSRDRLGRPLDVDEALLVPRKLKGLRDFAMEVVPVALADHANPADMTIRVSRELGEKRACPAGPAEEDHFHATRFMLIEEHAYVVPALESVCQPQGSIET